MVHLLTAPAIAERTVPFIDLDRRSDRLAGLLETFRPWSAAERSQVCLRFCGQGIVY